MTALFPDWLGPLSLDGFAKTHFQRLPYAAAGSTAAACALLQWETFHRVLQADEPVDVLTVAQGRSVDGTPPRGPEDVKRLMSGGVSVVIRGAERHDAGLAALARSFEEVVAGEVHVQLYATPAGTHSYGWHYDFEDVFIAQTRGVKEYYFRQNTVARQTVLGDELSFEAVLEEVSPLMSSRLEPGDFLYIPTRWWHFVRCVEESLSISVGVMPPRELHAARRLPSGWTGTVRPRL